MSRLILAAGLFLCLAAPAIAADPPAGGEKATPTRAEKKERQVCERVRETGSFRTIKVCRTAAQVEQDRKSAQEMMTKRTVDASRKPK